MQRRAHLRYAVDFGADVHTEQGVVFAATHDVSRGGCQLRSDRPLSEGVTVKIDLSLTVDGIEEAAHPRITVIGRIQWVAESEDERGVVHVAGVRFDSLTAAQGDWLEKILVERGSGGAGAPPVEPDADVDVDVDLDD